MSRSSRTLPLPFEAHTTVAVPSAPAHPPVPSPRETQDRLWLCLWLPRLPLEAALRGAAGPIAILSDEGRQHRIRWCTEEAVAAGVQPGMAIHAALALLPGLGFRTRDPAGEEAAVQRLAQRCLRLTPRISIGPEALLLEVAASVPLFGSLDRLCQIALEEAEALGHAASIAVAPTARAALWLARAGGGVRVVDATRLPGVLAPLSLRATGWGQAERQLLARLGLRRLGDCLRLPRDGLARRLGPACVADLDQALGRAPEVWPGWQPPEAFSTTVELPVETAATPLLRQALSRALVQLQQHLERRQGGAQLLWVHLHHGRQPPTLLRIGLLHASASAAHFEELAAIHLSALQVPAPVTAIRIEADLATPDAVPDADLLGHRADRGHRLAALIERLRMRLGLGAVHGLATRSEHRPECAWRAVQEPWPAGRASPSAAQRGRPLWILETPRRLAIQGEEPVFHGALTLDAGPERIESGWWDGNDVRRDYFTATSTRGERLWIFREHGSRAWYLHGLFG